MKRLLIALFLCIVFSSVAQAGKPGFRDANDPGLDEVLKGPGDNSVNGSCEYSCVEPFTATVDGRKRMVLALQLVNDNEVVNLYTGTFTRTVTWIPRQCPRFEVNAGDSWTLAWTLSRPNGKGHIIDAIEVTSGTCNP